MNKKNLLSLALTLAVGAVYGSDMYPYELPSNPGYSQAMHCEKANEIIAAGGRLELGHYYTGYEACRKYCDDNGIPLFALYGNKGCIHCWYAEVCFNSQTFRDWAATNDAGRVIYCFMFNGNNDIDQKGSKGYQFVKNGSFTAFPYSAFYWKGHCEVHMQSEALCSNDSYNSKVNLDDASVPKRIEVIKEKFMTYFKDWRPAFPDGGPYAEIVDDVEWTFAVTNGDASVTSVSTNVAGSVSVPSVLGGRAVTDIGSEAFAGCTAITSVTMPECVSHVGHCAFDGCSGLTNFDFEGAPPEGIADSGINQDIAIRYNVTYTDAWQPVIEGLEWTKAMSYTPIKKDGGPYTQAVDGIEWRYVVKNSEASVWFHDPSWWDWNVNKGTIAIPSSLGGCPVTSICGSAFSGCVGLMSVTIPSSVTSIGEGAFDGCGGLTNITVVADNPKYKSANGLLLTKDGTMLLRGCSGLASVAIPEGVTSICGSAFSGCVGLTSVTIPSSVTSIGEGAFDGCGGLTNITVIADNPEYKSVNGLLITKDGTMLLRGCNGNVTIPEGVTNIGERAFEGCSGLTSIMIPSSVTSIGDKAFDGCSGLGDVVVPGWECGIDFSPVTNLVISDGTTEIKDSAFSGCSGLMSVAIPSSVTSIGDSAFESCSGLTSITIPSSVTSIGNAAFYDCSGLTSVTMPSSVTSIGNAAFSYTPFFDNLPEGMVILESVLYWYKGECPSTVAIPEGVTRIGYGVFSGCEGLTSVTMPSSVTNIGDYAFCGCHGLTSITIPSSVTSIGEWAFYCCCGLTSMTIPSSVTSIGEWAFGSCSGLTSVTIAEGVTSIGDSAFCDCFGLTSVTIPSSVTSIGRGGVCALLRAGERGDTRECDEHWRSGIL